MSYITRFNCFECHAFFDTAAESAEHVGDTNDLTSPLPNPHRVYPIQVFVDDDLDPIDADPEPTTTRSKFRTRRK